jgi:DNA-binding MarR family transcriptional regulator
MKLQDLYSDPGHLIRRAYQISVAIFLEECQSFNLGLVDCAVLYGVQALPGTDQISLSKAIAIDRSTIARVVNRLAVRGLIERNVSEKDRRENRLFLTAEGKKIFRKIQPRIDEVNQRMLAPLKPSEQKQFIEFLTTICNANNESSRAPLHQSASASDEAG